MEIKNEMYYQHDIELAKFQRACNQIINLNGKLDEIIKRYQSAKDNNNRHFRYSLRNRMLVIEGMLTAYCSYAKMKKSEILTLRRNLNGETESYDGDVSSDDE